MSGRIMFRFDQQNSDRVFLQVSVDEQDCNRDAKKYRSLGTRKHLTKEKF